MNIEIIKTLKGETYEVQTLNDGTVFDIEKTEFAPGHGLMIILLFLSVAIIGFVLGKITD